MFAKASGLVLHNWFCPVVLQYVQDTLSHHAWVDGVLFFSFIQLLDTTLAKP